MQLRDLVQEMRKLGGTSKAPPPEDLSQAQALRRVRSIKAKPVRGEKTVLASALPPPPLPDMRRQMQYGRNPLELTQDLAAGLTGSASAQDLQKMHPLMALLNMSKESQDKSGGGSGGGVATSGQVPVDKPLLPPPEVPQAESLSKRLNEAVYAAKAQMKVPVGKDSYLQVDPLGRTQLNFVRKF